MCNYILLCILVYYYNQFSCIEFNTCENSKTTVNGSNVCTATVILEDDFNGNDLDRNKWNIDHLIPANSQVCQ